MEATEAIEEVEDTRPLAEQLADGMPLVVFSYVSRNKTVKSSMGAVEFDEDGYGTVTVTSEDALVKLDQLGWLLGSDRQRFFAPVAPPEEEEVVITEDNAALVTENATLQREMASARKIIATQENELRQLRAERDNTLDKMGQLQRERDAHVEAGAAKAKARVAEAEKKADIARKAAAKKKNAGGKKKNAGGKKNKK